MNSIYSYLSNRIIVRHGIMITVSFLENIKIIAVFEIVF